ncbi:hypothetical protein L6452_09446 [Arctium lappa]|uniref:Uncharacterized protein n=1 Tax=Arctium lappa TaxID=4217 RepID=A0ACB9DK27_ARCLA|nr:hypothetical protein L6452_09446 [Arctium lappa]
MDLKIGPLSAPESSVALASRVVFGGATSSAQTSNIVPLLIKKMMSFSEHMPSMATSGPPSPGSYLVAPMFTIDSDPVEETRVIKFMNVFLHISGSMGGGRREKEKKGEEEEGRVVDLTPQLVPAPLVINSHQSLPKLGCFIVGINILKKIQRSSLFKHIFKTKIAEKRVLRDGDHRKNGPGRPSGRSCCPGNTDYGCGSRSRSRRQ